MKLHGNARTCLHSRRLIVERVIEQGWPLARAADAAGVSVRTVSKWLARFRAEGSDGLLDRSSAPGRMPHRTPEAQVELIALLRRLWMTAAEIAEALGMPRSTVSAVLTRMGLGKRSRLEPAETANRYERRHPGELLHIDVKKLGRIGRPGHRVSGDRRRRSRGVGWEFVHICVDVDRPRFRGQRVVRRLVVLVLSSSRSRRGIGSRGWSAV
jgi:transposase